MLTCCVWAVPRKATHLLCSYSAHLGVGGVGHRGRLCNVDLLTVGGVQHCDQVELVVGRQHMAGGPAQGVHCNAMRGGAGGAWVVVGRGGLDGMGDGGVQLIVGDKTWLSAHIRRLAMLWRACAGESSGCCRRALAGSVSAGRGWQGGRF